MLSALPLKGSFDKGWWGGGEGRVEERGGIKQTGMELEMWVYKEAAAAAVGGGGGRGWVKRKKERKKNQ